MSVNQKIISSSPENRETPLGHVQSWVTPNRWFFVRSHFETPKIDLDEWKLTIAGSVQRNFELTWNQFSSLPRRTVFSTLECAGNGRSFLRPLVEGVQWTAGAVGHAEWSGVPLRSVLDQAGIKPETVEIVCEGADEGLEKGNSRPIRFSRSLPVKKAMQQDTLLATHMNGELLEPSHGYPVRLIVPGWYGVASVKWLNRIEAVAEPFRGFFQSVKYTIGRSTGHGIQTESVGPMPVKSEIIRPDDGDVCGAGANRVFGLAWAGEHAVAAVEVSSDYGRSWHRAELLGPQVAYSWTLWEYLWQVETPGDYTLLARAVSDSGEVQPTQHESLRGGYLINFSRPTRVRVDPRQRSEDVAGDWNVLQAEMASVARQRSELPLDADIDLTAGAGI